MELTPAKFLALFLFFSVTGWLFFTFAARLLSWLLSRMIGVELLFRFGGLTSLKDITLNLKKGTLESLAIGEVRLRTSTASKDPFNNEPARTALLQVLVYDAEVVLRKSHKENSKKGPQNKKSTPGRGKWMIFANIAKYINISVVELVLQAPDWIVEVKELDVGVDSEESGLSSLGARISLTTCNIYDREQQSCLESKLTLGQRLLSVGGLGGSADGSSTLCTIDSLSISSTFGHEREQGVYVKQLDITFGDVLVDVNEEILQKKVLTVKNRKVAEKRESDSHLQEVNQPIQDHHHKDHHHLLANAPDKAGLSLPRLLIRYTNKEKECSLDNEVIGLQFMCTRLQNMDETGGILSHLDVHIDSGEIHLLRESDKSLVEIMKTAVIASLEEIPEQQSNRILQCEVEVKLGGAQCNLLTNKFEKWMDVLYSIKPKRIEENTLSKEKKKSSRRRAKWTCTISAPDMTISLYNLDGVAIYNVSLQTSHVFLNSALRQGTGVHTELGELYIYMIEEEHSFYRGLFGMDTSPGCLLQVSRLTFDSGAIEPDDTTCETELKKGALVIEASGIAMYLTLDRLQSFLLSILGISVHLKRILAAHKRPKSSKGNMTHRANGRGTGEIKFIIEGVSIQYCSKIQIIGMDVPDPKKVNFGSQGGEVIIEKNIDGTQRIASIRAAGYRGFQGSSLICKSNVEISHLQIHVGCGGKDDAQVDLQRLKATYQELGPDMKLITEVIFMAVQSGQVVYTMISTPNGVPDCLICISDLKGRWEPDIHFLFFDVFMQLKTCYQKHLQSKKSDKANIMQDLRQPSKSSDAHEQSVKRKIQTVAVDLEQIELTAALADGVDASFSVASLFSEDFKVGILLEEMRVALNSATILKSKRLQIARVPGFIQNKIETTSAQECSKCGTELASCWDYLIQGSGVSIVLPYKLECRAIDDAVEDTWRALKLVMVAHKLSHGGVQVKSSNSHKKHPKKSAVGAVKFSLENITAEIEEEPLQGWLDEHLKLIRKHKLELDIRERFIIEGGKVPISKSDFSIISACGLDNTDQDELDFSDPITCKKLRDKLYQQTFQSYKKSCEQLELYEGSGSCRSAFQSGFKPSVNRGSLMSIKASNLEVTLMDIEGGRAGMIQQIRRLDCIAADADIPYSRILGKRVKLQTGSLILQIRNYTLPVLSAVGGKCDGQMIFARQATCFPKQIPQELYVGRWQRVTMLRSETGTTPPFKMFSELPIEFEKAEVAYGVGFEPSLTDISYAFSVALRRADLSVHDLEDAEHAKKSNFYNIHTRTKTQPVKKEKNLPWWDDMRYYIHGKNSINSNNFKWFFLATTNPYEERDMMKIEAGSMYIQQQDGSLSFFAKTFNLSVTSLESAMGHQSSKRPLPKGSQGCIQAPFFQLDITMDWDCDTGNPLFHYLHAFPEEHVSREKVYDPFRSTSLILRWNFRLGDSTSIQNVADSSSEAGCSSYRFKPLNARRSPMCTVTKEPVSSFGTEGHPDLPVMYLGGHDLAWIFKWWSTLYSPPHKLRTFSKWPKFGLPRVPRSGNLSLDKVLTDFMLRVDSTPTEIKHISLIQDDPAKGLTFAMRKFKYELCYSRGKERYTFDSKRDILELVYQGLDLHMLKAELRRDLAGFGNGCGSTSDGSPHDSNLLMKATDTGFFFTTDYFSLRKQAPKADLSRLSSWQEEARRPSNTTTMEFAHGSGSDPTRSDPSDDDGFSTVLPDNCLRISLYGLKLLWTLSNRDAVWAWVEDIYRAFDSPKPSPSRQYAQRKIMEEQNKLVEAESGLEEGYSSGSSRWQKGTSATPSPSRQEKPTFNSSPIRKSTNSFDGNEEDETEEGTPNFMVTVIQPQFNLQSEEARGRFLLAAASGRVMARTIHSIVNVRPEMVAQAFKPTSEHLPELTWSRRELSVILEQVQAHVAPTDVDPGAGLQWLPKIPRGSQKVKRTGALLERVFMPCEMYFQYTRCKSETADIKVKPLKELSFNSPNITARMTSRQFQVMLDIVSNLLLARLPKPRKNLSLVGGEEEESIEEETDEVVPDGVPEVELARIRLEESERSLKLLSADIKGISQGCPCSAMPDIDSDRRELNLWMMECGSKRILLKKLDEDWNRKLKTRKLAARSLRLALQRAAHQRFKEKEKSKSIPSAMRISWVFDKIVWTMLSEQQAFAEAEISSMNLNVDRDFREVGIAQFTIRHFVVKNCLQCAKSNTVLSAWNPPNEWGRKPMLRVDARQGAPKDGRSPMELFQAEIYPLRIYLTERMYRMMWDYFFPKEDRDSQRRQVWKASTTAGVKRGKKVAGQNEFNPSSTYKREQTVGKASSSSSSFLPGIQTQIDGKGVDLQLAAQMLEKDVKAISAKSVKTRSHRRSSSFDGIQDDKLPESLLLEFHPKDTGWLGSSSQQQCPQFEMVETTNQLVSTENGTAKSRDTSRSNKSQKASIDDKKFVKSNSQDEKKSTRLQHTIEFHNIKISQVELLITYEGSRLSVTDLRLLMDTFTRTEFTGTWRRLFSRIKKHIIWSFLKSIAGMQGKKFKDKLPSQEGYHPGDESLSSDSDESNVVHYEDLFAYRFKRSTDRAGEGFVSSIRGLFNSQRKKAKAIVLRAKRVDGEEAADGGWTEGEAESAPFTRQLSISKAKRLLRRHTKKFLSSTRHRGSILFKDRPQGSPLFQSEGSSDASSCYEDFND